ncbi:hypothetical protein BKA63DRAFT_494527 [Paraphoma chrysanthemicola]|nr:hypothetical protein BKA63DRAFT_494527 [Paraphoma chrysanthemicola]
MTGSNNNNQSYKGKAKAKAPKAPNPQPTSSNTRSATPQGPDWDPDLHHRERREHERRENERLEHQRLEREKLGRGGHAQAPSTSVSRQTVPMQLTAGKQSNPAHSAHPREPHNPPRTSAPTISNLLAPADVPPRQLTRQITHSQPHARSQQPHPPTRQNTDPMQFVTYDPHAPRSCIPYAPRKTGDGESHAHRNPSPKHTAPPRKPPANALVQKSAAHANPPANAPAAQKKKTWNAKQQYGQVAFATSRQSAHDHDTGAHIGTETWLTRNPSIPGAPTR